MNEIIRYNLEDKQTKPPFEFVLLTGDIPCLDYYLYTEDQFENAIEQLKKEFAKGFEMARVCIVQFSNNDRTYRLKDFVRLDIDGKVCYDRYGETHLHIKFYIDSGEWKNPENIFE